MKKAKIEMETLGKILLLTAFLIMFLLMFKGCQDQMKNVGTVGINEYICWLSKTMQADLLFLFPSACYPIDVEEQKDELGISVLMRKCWWMYGQGNKDITSGKTWAEKATKKVISWYDMAGTCYMFTPKDDIEIQEFITYLRTHDKSGNTAKEGSKETTWDYIQKISNEKTGICFDEKIEGKLLKGKRYFIIFYDDRSPIMTTIGVRDRILISRDPEFGVDQTGLLAWAKERFVSLGCEDWRKQGEKEQARQKKVCEGYDEQACYKNLDKCYPYFPIGDKFSRCEYCKEDIKCAEFLSEKACKLNPCGKACEWVSLGLSKTCIEKE